MSLFLTVILCSLLTQITLTVWKAQTAMTAHDEQTAMLTSIDRVFTEDAHGALAANVEDGVLVLKMPDGELYHYVVNEKHQLVRFTRLGGVTVLADAVSSVNAVCAQGLVTLTVKMLIGADITIPICILTRGVTEI